MDGVVGSENKRGWGDDDRVGDVQPADDGQHACRRRSCAVDGVRRAETKALSAKLQTSMLCDQVAEYAAHRRICVHCGVLQPLKERRTRRLQTLFGTVEVAAPRFKVCHCRRSTPMEKVALFSPIGELLTARRTPELERVQAELGPRASFRDAARILDMLLPASSATHESVRNRTHAVALRIEQADRQATPAAVLEDTAVLDAHVPIVMLDGAYIRAMPGHQVRNFEAICGKVEQEGHSSRRFGFVRSVAEPADALLRAALRERGWRQGEAVIAISDGDPALPALVRSATNGPVEHILDWFHLSTRLHHIEQVMNGLAAFQPSVPLDPVQVEVERLRHLLWNGHHEKAHKTLSQIVSWAETANTSSDHTIVVAKLERLVARCTKLRAYIENNTDALIDYGQRYRAGKPISSSRAESTVNQLVNARMNKRRQMRWSPQGAHRVLQVRAAVLDSRLAQQTIQFAA